ncbi:hypothetical protein [Aureliella helgolandensis]|uniref:Phosphate transport system permease protein PstC n=1 Tax=Aureliella helgolandensis TaxID=2527968 RepID=A0A518G8J3_9BACT|nr:hypothetical protein [Aureliella helgolandensis]QDV24905.1 Phosphate transport system permease protein PstC [Aureliella helgolandensis]
MPHKAYSRQRKRKHTPWSVRLGDAVFSRAIAVGGVGTIVAILLVVVVLLTTALPLLKAPAFAPWHAIDCADYRQVGVDDSGTLMWGLTEQGVVEVRETFYSDLLARYPLPLTEELKPSDESGTNDPVGSENPVVRVTCSNVSIDQRSVVVGLSNGLVHIAELEFETSLLTMEETLVDIELSDEIPYQVSEASVYERFGNSAVRRTRLKPVVWSKPIGVSASSENNLTDKASSDRAVLAVDFLPDQSASRLSNTRTSRIIALAQNELVLATLNARTNALTRELTESVWLARCPCQPRSVSGTPLALAGLNGGKQIVVAWPNGTLDRYSLHDQQLKFRESQSALLGEESLSCVSPLLGRETLLGGTTDGHLQGWMIARQSQESSTAVQPAADGYHLVMTQNIAVGTEPILAITSSLQTHVAVTADASGVAALTYVPTGHLLGTQQMPLQNAWEHLAVNRDGNLLLATTRDHAALAEFDVGYPEASWMSYFGKVWYEGYASPKYIWQSSAATERSEIKLSLVPLLFGTLKATFYAMLISVPLALLGAIYTSEFLAPSMRTRIKPLVELMASLPSVVLGYVAALVVAPYMESHLMAVLTCLLLIPATFVLAGHCWNLLPVERIVRWQGQRLGWMFLALPVAILLSFWLAGPIENRLFGGSLLHWLTGRQGNAIGGWMLILVPAFSLLTVIMVSGPLTEWTRKIAIRMSPKSFALLALLRLFALSALIGLMAWTCAAVFDWLGLDLRGYLFDNYQDKNALLVGAALGFCVIPIIYTLAEDALRAVPQQLRSASFGCGATPWQTTIRVVLPSAVSGLFSAVMIGLGRAIGETMIVLCAAGNTPLMEWNPFNGFKALSAALATELPEAAKGSTHFRTLFLAALLLFALTFFANTLAEVVRIRYRKRSSQL